MPWLSTPTDNPVLAVVIGIVIGFLMTFGMAL